MNGPIIIGTRRSITGLINNPQPRRPLARWSGSVRPAEQNKRRRRRELPPDLRTHTCVCCLFTQQPGSVACVTWTVIHLSFGASVSGGGLIYGPTGAGPVWSHNHSPFPTLSQLAVDKLRPNCGPVANTAPPAAPLTWVNKARASHKPAWCPAGRPAAAGGGNIQLWETIRTDRRSCKWEFCAAWMLFANMPQARKVGSGKPRNPLQELL